MKRFVFAVLAFAAVVIAAAPAFATADEPGSGTLTWSVPTNGE
jgi:hypothetical protein